MAHDGVTVLAAGLDHPEAVTIGPDGALYAGGEAGQLYRVECDGTVHELTRVEGAFMLGLCVDGAGRIYVCDFAGARILRHDPQSATTETWCEAAGGRPLGCPNWPVFAADGSLLVSDSGSEPPAEPDGRIVRVPPQGGEAEVLDLPPLAYPNGLALDDDHLYVAESYVTPGVRRLAPDTGRLEGVVALPGMVPDGLALDREGGLLVACYQPNVVLRVGAGGAVSEVVRDDTGRTLITPTNAAFFGDGLTRVALAQLGGWSLVAVDVHVAGRPLHHPGGPA